MFDRNLWLNFQNNFLVLSRLYTVIETIRFLPRNFSNSHLIAFNVSGDNYAIPFELHRQLLYNDSFISTAKVSCIALNYIRDKHLMIALYAESSITIIGSMIVFYCIICLNNESEPIMTNHYICITFISWVTMYTDTTFSLLLRYLIFFRFHFAQWLIYLL